MRLSLRSRENLVIFVADPEKKLAQQSKSLFLRPRIRQGKPILIQALITYVSGVGISDGLTLPVLAVFLPAAVIP